MDKKRNIILTVCVIAFLIAIVFGYKWVIEKLEETRKNVNSVAGTSAGGSSSTSNSSRSSETNNPTPVLYGIGEKLFTFGEYATLRSKPKIDNGFLTSNSRGTLKGEIGIVDKIVGGANSGDTHNWYHVILTTPLQSTIPFLEYSDGYVRDDVVTNKK